jgi:hypothetical protein
MSLDEHQRTRMLKKTSQEDFFTLALIPVTGLHLFSPSCQERGDYLSSNRSPGETKARDYL